jgi:hypothetical protein
VNVGQESGQEVITTFCHILPTEYELFSLMDYPIVFGSGSTVTQLLDILALLSSTWLGLILRPFEILRLPLS